MTETLLYLQTLSKRVTYYYSIRKKAINYIGKNRIKDRQLCINLIFMSALWAAHKREDQLTDDELEIFFALTPNGEKQDDFMQTFDDVKLTIEQEKMTLDEIFDLVVTTFKG